MVIAPWIKSIELRGGQRLELGQTTVLALVGPNNGGKTNFLKQLRSQLYGDEVNEQPADKGLIAKIEVEWGAEAGGWAERLLAYANKRWPPQDEYYQPDLPSSYKNRYHAYRAEDIRELANDSTKLGPFIDAFVRWDEPHSRIDESEKQQLNRAVSAAVSLARSNADLTRVSDLFFEIFEEHLSVYDLREGEIGFVLGEEPCGASRSTSGLSRETKEFMRNAPKLWFQGSGYRNVFGLLARMESDQRPIVLVDEPEAFLHPQQSAKLGNILGRLCQDENKQLICATHDRHFLTGLAQGIGEKLQVARLSFNGTGSARTYNATQVPLEFWRDIRDQSRARYSTVFESLFCDEVVLVESENDALFYQEAIEHSLAKRETQTSGSVERLFIPVGGNAEFAPMSKLVRSLGPRVVVLGDVDLVAHADRFESTVRALVDHLPSRVSELRNEIESIYRANLDLGRSDIDRHRCQLKDALEKAPEEAIAPEIKDLMHKLLEDLERKQKTNNRNMLQQRMARDANLRSRNEDVVKAVKQLLDLLVPINLVLVPQGEIEHFDTDLLKEVGKQAWVHEALKKDVHKNHNVQSFVETIQSLSLASG